MQTKLLTVEKHLPTIVQEILEYYFDKKMSDLQATLVDQKTFKEAMLGKLDINIFRAYEKRVAADRSREERNFVIDERLHSLERALPTFVTKEENAEDMKEKASLETIDELKALLEKNKQINFSEHEKLAKRLETLKAEHEEQVKELMDQMLTLETKIDKFEEEAEEGESYDEEEEEDLGSESLHRSTRERSQVIHKGWGSRPPRPVPTPQSQGRTPRPRGGSCLDHPCRHSGGR